MLNTAPAGGLIAADVDRDGRDDLVYVNSTGSALLWRGNQTVSAPSFAGEAVLWNVPVGTRLSAEAFVETAQRFRSLVRNGDFNGDGRVDLLVLAQQGTCGANATCPTWVNRWMVLGSTGRNFAAGMSGGVAFVLNELDKFQSRCNLGMVELEQVTSDEDKKLLHDMITSHFMYTGSRNAKRILDGWDAILPKIVKVMPID